MQIVQKDISENLHIRDVGLYAVKLGGEDSDAPPQGGFSHSAGTSNHKVVDAANVFIILGLKKSSWAYQPISFTQHIYTLWYHVLQMCLLMKSLKFWCGEKEIRKHSLPIPLLATHGGH